MLLLVIWRYLLSMLEATVSRCAILMVVAFLLIALLLLVVVTLALLLWRVALLLVAALFPARLLRRVLALGRALLITLVVLIVGARHGSWVSLLAARGVGGCAEEGWLNEGSLTEDWGLIRNTRGVV